MQVNMKHDHDSLLRQPALDGTTTRGAGEDSPSKLAVAVVFILFVLDTVGIVLPALLRVQVERGLRWLMKSD